MDASYSSWPHSPIISPVNHPDQVERQKKPRHRHSTAQLAALNELYDKNEHPSLDQRANLAMRLGMETKTVNAWFQNKRASTKKRTRGNGSYDLPPLASTVGSTPPPSRNNPRQAELDDFPDEEYLHLHDLPTSAAAESCRQQVALYVNNPEHTLFFAESDPIPRRMRMRPSPEQAEELRKLYITNPHPTREDREELGDRIGMRYQSVTNWFQNQRSLAKKRKEDEADTNPQTSKSTVESHHESRTFSAFPPPIHSSLLPSESRHLPHIPAKRRSRSISLTHPDLSFDEHIQSRGLSPRRSVTPYRPTSHYYHHQRPRRSRPEPYQLDALKDLFGRTSNPSIEERSALALDIGMDVGKVTNWFRNLRQTARKRTRKAGDDNGDNDSINTYSTPVSRSGSRSGTPSLHSSSPSSMTGVDEQMDLDGEDMPIHSELGSDDEYQEALTPSPEPWPSPPLATIAPTPRHRIHLGFALGVDMGLGPVMDSATYAELEKVTAARFSGVKLEDALLLLSFHQHIVQ